MPPEFWENLPATLTALALLVGAVGVLVMNILTYRRQGVAIKISTDNAGKIDVIGENVDGKMDKLLAAREEAATAKGQLKERDAERAHLSEAPAPLPVTNGTDEPLQVEIVKKKNGEVK